MSEKVTTKRDWKRVAEGEIEMGTPEWDRIVGAYLAKKRPSETLAKTLSRIGLIIIEEDKV